MRVLAVCLLVFATSTSIAVAGANEGCGLFIDLTGTAEDWADVVAGDNAIYPQLGESFDVYVGLANDRLIWDNQGDEWDPDGDLEVTTVVFGVECDVPTALYDSVDCLLPGGSIIELTPFPGINFIVLGGQGHCHTAPVVYVARLTFMCMIDPGEIVLVEHSGYGREVTDCTIPDELVDEYCIINSAGVGQLPSGGEAGCEAYYDNPVESRTWGSIKALYRSGN